MRRNRSSVPPPQWQIQLLALLYGVVVVLALFIAANIVTYIARSIIQPQIALHRLATEKSVLEQRVAQKKHEIAELQKRKAWWSDPIGKEELAREKAGLVRKGEHTVVITPPPPPAPKTASAGRQAATAEMNPTLRISMVTLVTFVVLYGVLLLRRRRLIKVRQEVNVGVLTPRKELLRRRQTPTTDH